MFCMYQKNDAENGEKMLAAYSMQFKGSCIKCGKNKHKSVICLDDGKSKNIIRFHFSTTSNLLKTSNKKNSSNKF